MDLLVLLHPVVSEQRVDVADLDVADVALITDPKTDIYGDIEVILSQLHAVMEYRDPLSVKVPRELGEAEKP
jgi:hypothetical protein